MDVDAADISQAKSGVDEAASAAQSALSDVSMNRGLQSNIDLSNSPEGFTVSSLLLLSYFAVQQGLQQQCVL